MKKHSFQEHYDDFEKWLSTPNAPQDITMGNYEALRQRIFFTAYERWLNDRELFSVENAQPDDFVMDRETGIWRRPRETT